MMASTEIENSVENTRSMSSEVENGVQLPTEDTNVPTFRDLIMSYSADESIPVGEVTFETPLLSSVASESMEQLPSILPSIIQNNPFTPGILMYDEGPDSDDEPDQELDFLSQDEGRLMEISERIITEHETEDEFSMDESTHVRIMDGNIDRTPLPLLPFSARLPSTFSSIATATGMQSSGESTRQSMIRSFIQAENANVQPSDQHDARNLQDEIQLLHDRQQQTLRGLLTLRLEQFRLRHQQMVTLLNFIQANGSQMAVDRDSINEIRGYLDTVGADLLNSIRQLSTVNSISENVATSARSTDSHLPSLFPSISSSNDRTLPFINRTEERSSFSISGIVNPADRLVELIRLRAFLELSNKPKGASDEQIRTLSTRIFVPSVNESATSDIVDTCSICQEVFKAGDVQTALKCSHWHCQSCLEPWLKQNNACPLCRTAIEPLEKAQEVLTAEEKTHAVE